jgi:hypothetical protein
MLALDSPQVLWHAKSWFLSNVLFCIRFLMTLSKKGDPSVSVRHSFISIGTLTFYLWSGIEISQFAFKFAPVALGKHLVNFCGTKMLTSD